MSGQEEPQRRVEELGGWAEQTRRFYGQRGIGARVGYGDRPALLVIDMGARARRAGRAARRPVNQWSLIGSARATADEIRHVVEHLPLEDAGEAYRVVRERRQFGKLILVP